MLLAVLVSLPVPLMEKAVDTVPSLMPRIVESAFTTKRNWLVPGPQLARVQLKVGVEPTAGSVQFQPEGTVADWKRSDPLLKLLRFTLVAVSGPPFAASTVQVMFWS